MCADFEATRLNANVFCGNSAGLATKKEAKRDGTNNGTVCSKPNYLYNIKTFLSEFRIRDLNSELTVIILLIDSQI